MSTMREFVPAPSPPQDCWALITKNTPSATPTYLHHHTSRSVSSSSSSDSSSSSSSSSDVQPSSSSSNSSSSVAAQSQSNKTSSSTGATSTSSISDEEESESDSVPSILPLSRMPLRGIKERTALSKISAQSTPKPYGSFPTTPISSVGTNTKEGGGSMAAKLARKRADSLKWSKYSGGGTIELSIGQDELRRC